MLAYIRKQRSNSGANGITLTTFLNLITLLSSLDVSTYCERFENPFLAASNQYFAQEAEALLIKNAEGSLSIGGYLAQVDQRLAEEGARADLILSSASSSVSESKTAENGDLKEKVLRIVEQQMVAQQTEDILDGLPSMFDNLDDMSRLYTLLGRVDALAQLKKSLQALVQVESLFPE